MRIGRFGVGVCAAFLLGNEVQVITRHFSSPEERGVCVRFVERDDTIELYRCAAPTGTTIRVRLGHETFHKLANDPKSWDWFGRADPVVQRAIVRGCEIRTLESTLHELVRNGELRELSVPPYGTVRWAPSPESYRAHVFVNGVPVTSLHRNFDENIFAEVPQLKQSVIDIDDAAGATDLLLTRNDFSSLPRPVFDAVQRDAIADTVAWLVTVARSGDSHTLPWDSRLWEEHYYSPGEGDGVVRTLPFVITDGGLIPLDEVLLTRAGFAELDFLLFVGNMRLHGEPQSHGRDRPDLTARQLLGVAQSRPGAAVGAMQVDMFGGFRYSTVAAGIEEAFTVGRRLKTAAGAQLVTPGRGEAYVKMDETRVVVRWGDAILLTEFPRTAVSNTSDDGRAEVHATVAGQHPDDHVQQFAAALGRPGIDSAGQPHATHCGRKRLRHPENLARWSRTALSARRGVAALPNAAEQQIRDPFLPFFDVRKPVAR